MFKSRAKNVCYVGIDKNTQINAIDITLGCTKDFYFKCISSEKIRISDILNYNYMFNKKDYAVVQAEKHADDTGIAEDKWCYRIVVRFKNAKRYGPIWDLGQELGDAYPKSCVVLEKSNDNSVSYCYKYREDHEPFIVGKANMKFINHSIALRLRKEVDTGIVRRSHNDTSKIESETLLIDDVIRFMIDHGIFVNEITRDIIGMEYNDFMKMLEKELHISERYSLNAVYKIEKLIKNESYHRLPGWIPDMDILGFSDYNYMISTGKRIDKVDDVVPFYITTAKFPGKYPKNWLTCVKTNKFDLSQFINSFSLFYRKKERGDSVLYIHGDAQTGKSTLIEPYAELYKNTACYVSGGKGYRFSHTYMYPKVIISEFDFELLHRRGSVYHVKNLLEGAEFSASAKHGSQKRLTAKNTVITSNSGIPNHDLSVKTSNIASIRARLDIYKTLSNTGSAVDVSIINSIKYEAAAICVLCTQTENYIAIE